MGIRFSKQIKLGSLLKLNISKSGVSATVGKKGASINLGKNGTYLNLSPSIVGIKGTGLSYRQKLTKGYSGLLKKDEDKITLKNEVNNIDTSVIDEYNEILNTQLNLQKISPKVLSKEEFDSKIDSFEVEASKDVYQMYISGDEEVIENSIGAFLNDLDLGFEVSANYELEDHDLFIDLNLPEIEDFKDEYPFNNKGEIVYKKKTINQLKEEYAKTILGLGIYLSANFFNVSSYIDEVIISAFSSRRDNNGDLVDEYLYSIKYLRDEFVKTNFEDINDSYNYLLKFENRINISATHSFKAIKPYEKESTIKTNSYIDDAMLALKEFGYKKEDIERVLPKINEMKFESASDYLKEALKILSGK